MEQPSTLRLKGVSMEKKELTSKFITMRVPMALYEQIKAQSVAESRSVSGQITYLLKKLLG